MGTWGQLAIIPVTLISCPKFPYALYRKRLMCRKVALYYNVHVHVVPKTCSTAQCLSSKICAFAQNFDYLWPFYNIQKPLW